MGVAVSLGLLLAGNFMPVAQQPNAQAPVVPQELTQGPIHEAFGAPVVFNPQPGPVSPKKPPAPVDELPSDQKPATDNLIWIAGYWFWDDQRQDFLWVSGFWRLPPPDRIWVPGYWADGSAGSQWVSGFWSAASTNQTEYLPKPPDTLEQGPSTATPGDDYIWAPGCWLWVDNRYFWRPGHWTQAYPDWAWMPAHYVWTPSGYLFAGGYWDYSLSRRGLLFSPVYFPQGYLASQGNFIYTPSLVLDSTGLTSQLFVRPNHQHYYFGDYYAAENLQAGFYPSFAYHNSRLGYDPLFAHSAWLNGRQDRNWTTNQRNEYVNRRDHVEARPPHTFAAQQLATREPNARFVPIARPLADVVRQKNNAVPFQKVEAPRLQEYVQHANHGRTVIQDRANFEQKNVLRPAPKVEAKLPAEVRTPTKWEMPRQKPATVTPPVAAHLPPALPQAPVHHVEPPKIAQPLPHPDEVLRRPPPPPPPPPPPKKK